MSKLNIVPTDFGKLRKYCSPVSISYLEDSLERLRNGQAPTPAFPLYGKRDPSIVEEFINDQESKITLPWLIEYERSRLKKVGQQGGIPSWEDLRDLFQLYQTALRDVSYIDKDIIDEMKREYSKLNCQKKSAPDTLDHLRRSDKIETRAAGWPEFQLKKTDPLAQKIALKFAGNGDWKHGDGYTFARYNKLKHRIFMPMPFCSMVKQAQYFIPFLGSIQMDLLSSKNKSPHIAWADKVGFENCFKFMEMELKAADIQPDEKIVYFSNDFEKMDTTTGTTQYATMFIPVIQAAFHNVDNKDIEDTMLFTTTAPIICPDGTMIGDHGTASGAEVTNGGECVCNDYYQRRLFKVLKKLLPNGWRLLLRRFNGDDSAIMFAIKMPLDKFFNILKKAISIVCDETGFKVQTEKLDISEEYGKYCQNVYYYDRANDKLVWMYPVVLTLNSIIHPEKEYKKADWDKDYRDLDIIQKLDNAVNHPLYHDLVDYVMDGMKYPLLGKSEPETKRILSKYDRYRQLQSLGERYNRQDYDISSSPTVKYILAKR